MTKFSRLTSLATVALGALLYPLSLAAYQDAPILQGKGLPLVAERLPDQPEVIKPSRLRLLVSQRVLLSAYGERFPRARSIEKNQWLS